MKIRIALGVVGALLLAALIGLPSWTKATAQDNTWEIQFLDASATLTPAEDEAPSIQLAQDGRSGLGHWLNTERKCQVEKWWAPGGLIACKSIYVGGRHYHIAGVRGRVIYVD